MVKSGIGRNIEEDLPSIGTVRSPAFFFNGSNLLLSYEIAPISAGGVAIVEFADVLHFELLPINTRGLVDWHLPAKLWSFTEVEGADLTEEWAILKPRLWTISFNDLTIVLLFNSVRLVNLARTVQDPVVALVDYMKTR
jgi:hypothetical protein